MQEEDDLERTPQTEVSSERGTSERGTSERTPQRLPSDEQQFLTPMSEGSLEPRGIAADASLNSDQAEVRLICAK